MGLSREWVTPETLVPEQQYPCTLGVLANFDDPINPFSGMAGSSCQLITLGAD